MNEVSSADLIAAIRQIRKLVVTLDAIGFPARSLYADEELSKLIPNGLSSKVVNIAYEIHNMLQELEKSKRYRESVRQHFKQEE